jgi:hypothetical protein
MQSPAQSSVREILGASRYHIVGSLGSGGMAEVHLALQTSVGQVRRLAAVKRIRSEMAESRQFVEMFLEEARISAVLSHPNVAHVYEVGCDASGCFMVMEFLRGQSYARILDEVGFLAFDYRCALEVLIATLNGLEYAHGLTDVDGQVMALVHRDISPGNVFVTYDGQVKILDFGIAKATGSSVHTQTGVIKGKVHYMAPEQLRADRTDMRADLYAVGVMLWEATHGAPRWGALPDISIMSELGSGRPPQSPLAEQRGLPVLANQICARALAPEPRHRYRTAAEFRADLLELAALLGPRPSARELGRFVAARFSAEERQQQALIDAALAQLEGGGGHVTDLDLGTRVVARDTTAGPVSAQPRAGERRSAAIVGVLLLVVTAVVAWFKLGGFQGNHADAGAAVAPQSLPEAARPPPESPRQAAIPAAPSIIASDRAPAPRKPAVTRAASSTAPPAERIRLDPSDPWRE